MIVDRYWCYSTSNGPRSLTEVPPAWPFFVSVSCGEKRPPADLAFTSRSAHSRDRDYVSLWPTRLIFMEIYGVVARQIPWPFPGGSFPRNLGAVVQRTALSGELPVWLVVHDDENDWCVGDDVNDPNVPGASVVVHMAHVLDRDSSVSELASLPPGWAAMRDGPEHPASLSGRVTRCPYDYCGHAPRITEGAPERRVPSPPQWVHSLMVDMPVIVRHQDRGALRLDHRHNADERALLFVHVYASIGINSCFALSWSWPCLPVVRHETSAGTTRDVGAASRNPSSAEGGRSPGARLRHGPTQPGWVRRPA